MTRDDTTRETMSRTGRQTFENMRDLPPEMLPAGMDVIWATETVHGQYQEANMTARLNRDGYVALTTADVPGLKLKTLPGREVQDPLIRNGGGQVLLGRPKEWGDEDRAAQVRQAREAEIDAKKGGDLSAAFGDSSLAHSDTRERTVVRRGRPRSQPFPE